MSDAAVYAIIAAIPTIIASIGTMIVVVIAAKANAVKNEVLKAQGEATADKTDKIVVETEKIHKAVNSNWSTIKGELDTANKEIVSLKEIVEKANLIKANERIAGLEALLQKVLKTNGIESEPKSPSDVSQLTVREGEAAQAVITKTDV